jgi:hypothetical protein
MRRRGCREQLRISADAAQNVAQILFFVYFKKKCKIQSTKKRRFDCNDCVGSSEKKCCYYGLYVGNGLNRSSRSVLLIYLFKQTVHLITLINNIFFFFFTHQSFTTNKN